MDGKVDTKLWSPGRVKAYKAALQQATPPTLAILRIPRLELEVPVYDGTTDAVFDLAAGRIEGTALPGATGNVGIAGHRDGFFRVLKKLKEGDALVLDAPSRRAIPCRVDPDYDARGRQRDRPDARPAVTLVGCSRSTTAARRRNGSSFAPCPRPDRHRRCPHERGDDSENLDAGGQLNQELRSRSRWSMHVGSPPVKRDIASTLSQ